METSRFTLLLQRLATLLGVAIFTLCFFAAFTGVLLAFYYSPVAGEAYRSVENLTTQVPNGWLIHTLHDLAGQGLIIVSLLQIGVMFLGRQFRFGWLTAWISGITLTLSAIGLSWTAMNLSWTQLGYWRLNIELNILETIPFIGVFLRNFLTGGEAIGTTTVQHLFALHSYILSIVAIILSIIHLVGLLIQERQKQSLEPNLAVTQTNTTSLPLSQSDQAQPIIKNNGINLA